MRVDTNRLDVKKIVSIGTAIMVILLLSNLSLAGVVDGIKDELGEHDVLSSLVGKDADGERSPTTTVYRPGSSSGTTTGSNAGSDSNSESTGNNKEPLNTDLYSQMKRYAEYYNSGIDEVPDVVKKVAGNDVILIDIAMNDNSNLKIKARTKDGMIIEFRKLSSGESIDPSVTLTGDEGTIRAILRSEDPLGYFVKSLNQGSVDVECKGFLKKAALSALKALV